MDVTTVVTNQPVMNEAPARGVGHAVFGVAVFAFIVAGLPVVWRGAPLGDDFTNCLGPLRLGLDGFLAESWDRLGVVRLARFAEILLTTGVCRALPFGVAIAVPLLLTLSVALLVRGLLRDLDTPRPWADVGGALWLLQPLGTEAGLWPAALHVPLGLAFALVALRLHHRGRHGWAVLAAAGAAVSVEQTILALPLAAWLVSPPGERRRATIAATSTATVALLAFALWPGADPRLRVGPVERIAALTNDPAFYVAFPAVGLGLHSIPLAIQWALPWSVIVLTAGAVLGAPAARRLPRGSGLGRRDAVRGIIEVSALLAIVNAPVLLNVPHQGSPRVFTPTWLVLVVAVTALAARIRWRRPSLLGAAAGTFAACALLSMALSVSVRLASADFTERSAHLLAGRLPDRAEVAVCGVRRAITTLAPRGAFAVHDLLYDWSARNALIYYTGRRATFHIAGELWERPCPNASEVDAVITFDELLAGARP